jgi:ribosomal protein S18 acetylase RimI-like enzyme
MSPLLCREASLDDTPAMARLREASGWTEGAPEARMRLYLLGEHHPQKALAPRVAYVAEADGAIVGFIAGHLTTRFGCEGELQWLLVAPAHRGGGPAGQLLLALAGWFGRQGAARVCVNVARENERARRFYRRHGAQELGEHWMVWQQIEQGFPNEG